MLIKENDILFAMHETCTQVVKHVYAAKEVGSVELGRLPTLRTYYDKMRRQCRGHLDEFGIVHWPHEHYGAMEFWDWDDWDYREGCQVSPIYLSYFLPPDHTTVKILMCREEVSH